MKLTLIVQRYGVEIVGGAERLCRGLAEGLAPRHDVEVVTTCARSYLTWANHYREGLETLHGVRVRRFRTARERHVEEFNELSEQLFSGPRTPERELEWVEAQGPCAPRMLDYLHAIAGGSDLLLFFTYLYYPTLHGIHVAPARSLLVPTAHDEAPFWMDVYQPVFTLPAGLIFNTRAEQDLVQRRFPEATQPQQVIGVGIEGLDRLAAARTDVRATPPALLYAGRIEAGKGVGELVDFVARYRHSHSSELRLWLIGEQAMELPERDWIEPLGFVSEIEKAQRLAAATLLVAPSALESFGIVLLEALAAGTPVLANAASAAYVEHCRAGDCGLFYADYPEFENALELLLNDAQLRAALAANGSRYVRSRYSWKAIVRRYEEFLQDVQR